MPPVGMRIASPLRTRPGAARPISTAPTTRSGTATPSLAPAVSAARTAYPSMYARAKCGTSIAARTGRASTRSTTSVTATDSVPSGRNLRSTASASS